MIDIHKVKELTQLWCSFCATEKERVNFSWKSCSNSGCTLNQSPNKPWKFKQALLNWKLMVPMSWDKGIMLTGFMASGTTVMSGDYCQTLNKLWMLIQNKRCKMLSKGTGSSVQHMAPHQRLHKSFTWAVQLRDFLPWAVQLGDFLPSAIQLGDFLPSKAQA